MTPPALIRVEARSSSGEPHPALVEPDGDGWQEWRPPADGWHEVREVVRSEAHEGITRLTAGVEGEPTYLRMTFERRPGERFWGFGERSDATEHSGSLVEHWVGEGPYQLSEYPIVEAITPRWAIRRRRDATYYPIPWLLSSNGFGALTDSPEWSCHDLNDEKTWSVIALATKLVVRFFAGPTPAASLARFTEVTGRQPVPTADWFFGPWIQTGQADLVPLSEERAILDALKSAGTNLAAVETHMRRLPGGAHVELREAERARTHEFHSRGLRSLTYLSPTISRDFAPAFDTAEANDAFEHGTDGRTTFTAYIGGREPPVTEQALLDFTSNAAIEQYRGFVEEAFEDGHDGWMEDFGEYSPRPAEHNLYPLRYHRAVAEITAQMGRSPARFVRSGWTGSAAYSPLVWGGDPTTCWGFDGLRSALTEGLSMGLSGVAFWGSDIGGFFTLGEDRLTPELLIRWIQLSAMSPLMRTKAGGVALGNLERPQVWDPEILPHWRRWAAFHDRLIPYMKAAAQEYHETGMPLMRHHALTDPDDARITSLEDQYRFGPDLLVAPVLEPAMRDRTVRLPEGEWIDLWRSVRVGDNGSIETGKLHVLSGRRAHVIPAPLDEIPILVRAGARVPGLDLGS